MNAQTSAAPVFRADRFVVPQAARAEFLSRVKQTHTVLRQQPGFVRELILERQAGSAESHIITIVEWESAAVMSGVREVVAAHQKSVGFNPAELIARLGIEAEFGVYEAIRF
ncbi:MAG TPA: antibiotic biosynthesis monooxygenase [Mesorhizobium sp.]|jgi:heme-degrading monooxygenase HmoA|nr:antibiotic biosynthesis monooxygenase [Mesorhizobium sp.]